MKTNTAVKNTSASITAPMGNPPGEWAAVAVGGESGGLGAVRAEVGGRGRTDPGGTGDDVDDQAAEDAADDLADDVERELPRLGLADHPQADGDRRIDVAPRDGADGVGGDQEAEAEGQGDAEDAHRARRRRRSDRWPGWRCRDRRRPGSWCRPPRRFRCAGARSWVLPFLRRTVPGGHLSRWSSPVRPGPCAQAKQRPVASGGWPPGRMGVRRRRPVRWRGASLSHPPMHRPARDAAGPAARLRVADWLAVPPGHQWEHA